MDELLVAIQEAANTIAAPNCADKLSVLLSLLAILAAGFVAWRQNKISREQTEISKRQTEIADRQNKIALFEKRHEIYDLLYTCRISVQILKAVKTNEDILRLLFILFDENPQKHQEFNRDKAQQYLASCSTKLQYASFFFPQEIASYITSVSVELSFLADADAEIDGPEKYNEKKKRYFEAVEDLEENKVFERIRTEIKIM